MVRDGKATAYEIMINEDQRVALLELVQNALHLTGRDQPLEYWADMLKGLPADEIESPGVTHGFCL